MAPTTAPVTKQNGETPSIKTTTINISSSSKNTALSSNTNSNNSKASSVARSYVLSASASSSLATKPLPVPASVGFNTEQYRLEREKTKILRDHTEMEHQRDADVHTAADKQNKPSSDIL